MKPSIEAAKGLKGCSAAKASHHELGDYYFVCDGDVPLLFTENETNNEHLFRTANMRHYVKDGINNCIVHGKKDAVNSHKGTKVSAHYTLTVGAGMEHEERKGVEDNAKWCDVLRGHDHGDAQPLTGVFHAGPCQDSGA